MTCGFGWLRLSAKDDKSVCADFLWTLVACEQRGTKHELTSGCRMWVNKDGNGVYINLHKYLLSFFLMQVVWFDF